MHGTDRGLRRLIEIAVAFLQVGCIAFGGPAAHLALLEDEFVTRRGWLGRQRFLDLMGATNLVPGPNSTEMTMHVGYERGGAGGLIAAGIGFVLPAAILTALLAWLYVRFGSLPSVEPVMAGIRPAVLVVIAGAVWKLGRKAITRWSLGLIATGVVAAVWSGVGEIAALVAGGLIGGLLLRFPRPTSLAAALAVIAIEPARLLAAAVEGADLAKLGLFFLKVGAVLYGSGYVLVAFLEGGLVEDYGWLTRQQLLDAIAVGQFTPGPVLTAATFIGFVIAGPKGAAVATAGIFLPAFGFSWAMNPLVHRLRRNATSAALLDAINASAVGLMAAVAADLAVSSISGPVTSVIAACAIVGLFWIRWTPAWIILSCGALGWLASVAGWL